MKNEEICKLKITLRLGRVPVRLCERGTPEGAPEAAPSPVPETVLKRAEAALATAPAPAERAAPPAATIPPAFAVAAAPTAAPALQENENLEITSSGSKKRNATPLKNYLREGSHMLLQNRQDSPDHNCNTHQTGHAPKG